jgi:hypothetical protein
LFQQWWRKVGQVQATNQFNFMPKSFKIQHEGDNVVELQLYARVNVDGCTWTLDGGGKTLLVTCEKAEEGQMWPRIQLSA